MPFESMIFLLVAFTISFPFLMTMKRCLDQMAPVSRQISRSQLWLNLIPVFNVIWVFVTARRFSLSMAAEVRRRPATTGDAHSDKGLLTAALFAGFMGSLPLGGWNVLMFGIWILALALYWKDIAMQMLWLMQNPAS